MDVFEVPLSGNKMKREKAYREQMIGKIVATVCALLNSIGGSLFLKFEDESELENEVNSALRMIEQRLVDIIGCVIFNSKVKIQRFLERKDIKLGFKVDRMESLCTLDYHFYLPTQTQVIPISPWESSERVKVYLHRNVCVRKQIFPGPFLSDKQVPFKESDSIQFKHLKAEKSKCVSLADRITNKSNKLERYVSAFANKSGGELYYGITCDGIVKGEVIEVKDQEEIVRKVTKIINHMIWSGGELKRGKDWNIQFAPVQDENQNEIPSLFVVIISVVSLRGGLFTQEPESYHVVHGRAEKMTFTEWSRRFFADEQSSTLTVMDMVPSVVGRTQWSSVKEHRIFYQILQSLVKYQNDGDHYGFEKFAALAQRKYRVTEVKLVTLGEKSAHAYKSGQFEKADRLIAEYEKCLSRGEHTKDCSVFKFREAYAKSAICCAKGDYQKSYDIAQECLQLAEMVPAGILVAWFYTHVAIVEKRLSQETKEDKTVSFAVDHYMKALQHTQASTVEQEFSITVADLQQRIHIFRAVTLLGDFANGANFRKATPSDIKAAETDLSVCDRLIVQGFKETKYRKIYHLFSLSDLLVCRWWQHQQRQQQIKEESCETSYLLKEAFDYATEAKELSIKCHFPQLTNYARYRLAVIIEMMIKLKVSRLCLPRNRVNND